MQKTIVLASSSPRRLELVATLGYPWKALSADVDESFEAGASPRQNAISVALRKARGALGLSEPDEREVFLGVDTVVVCGGEVFTKPKSREDCLRMLSAYSGASHEVISGVAILAPDGRSEAFSVSTKVRFSVMSEEEMASYASSAEPYDKAGAYAIQGIGARYIEGIEGDFYNVMGFPLNRIYQSLTARFGFGE